MKRADGRRVCDGSPESMHGAAGAPPQLTDGACVAAQSTDVAALRHTLQARPLALRLHRERAIVAKNTDLCAADLHVGRALRKDNRGPRISRCRAPLHRSTTEAHRHAADVELYSSTALSSTLHLYLQLAALSLYTLPHQSCPRHWSQVWDVRV